MGRIKLGDLFPDTPPEEAPTRTKNEKPTKTPEEETAPLDDQIRQCGACGASFLSVPRKARPTFIPLFCAPCDALRATPLSFTPETYTKIYDADGVTLKAIKMKKLPPETQPRTHARYSPSTYGSREACAGWTQDRDPAKDTAAADRGTAIHLAIEKEDLSTLVDQGDIACAKKCIDYVESLATEAGPHERFRELSVKVLDQSGIVDDLIISQQGTVGDMTDYKTGYRRVPDAEVNPQVQGYALGVFDQFPKIATLNVHLLMPRQDEVSFATYTRAEHYQTLKQRTFKVIEAARAAEQLFEEGNMEKLLSILIPSANNCEFCGRKGICPALHNMALTIVTKYDPTLVIPEELHGSAITDPSMMTKALMIAPILEGWIKGVKKAALEMRMEQGIEIPGYFLAERSGARKITDAQAAWECVKDRISPEEFAGCADVSMPELEKAVAAKAPRGAKEGAKQALEHQLRDRDALKDSAVVHFLKQNRA